ncbi:MAG: heavy metal translocating P-type ATPase [Cyclobacteriaceae bacterium]
MTRHYELPLTGLDSELCAAAIETALAAVPGVVTPRVEYNNRRALVDVDDSQATLAGIIKTIRNVGYDVPLEKYEWPVEGMTCASCALFVESTLREQAGVTKAAVNYANQTAQVETFAGVTPQSLRVAVQSAGYDLTLVPTVSTTKDPVMALRGRVVAAAVLTLPVVLLGMVWMEWRYANYLMMVLSAPVVFWLGRNFFVHAWKQARHGHANMDTLVALSTSVAFVFSVFNTFAVDFWHRHGQHPHVYFEAAAVIITFILLGKFLEERAKSRTSEALKSLMGLQPSQATLVTAEGKTETVEIASVVPGQLLLVRAGEKIPADGVVKEGLSFVNESTITGESVPVEKRAGQEVFAGTLNQDGSLFVMVNKPIGDTLLARIIRRVRDAQGTKAPVQKLVDKVAGIFVPAVLVIAVLTLLAWLVLGGTAFLTQGLLAMVSVLVIACPCALGLATPTAIMVGMGKGAANGILIRDAESLEQASKIDVVVLDKTGTLTMGKPVVAEVLWKDPSTAEKWTPVVYALESQSSHPLAMAVSEYCSKEGGRVAVGAFTQLSGLGVQGEWQGRSVLAGSQALMKSQGIVIDQFPVERPGASLVYFAADGALQGVFVLSDHLRDEARDVVSRLQSMGKRVVMLTGDREEAAANIATAVGITHYESAMLPAAKADRIRGWREEGKIVAMVGDGVNDAEAMAVADVSIAMGEGSDVAMDVARMTLVSGGLRKLPMAMRLSQQIVATIRQNLFWAFVYNAIGIPLAAGVLYPVNGFLLNPMIAGAAMALSSVSVVTNSLRLRTRKLE